MEKPCINKVILASYPILGLPKPLLTPERYGGNPRHFYMGVFLPYRDVNRESKLLLVRLV